MTPLLSKNFNGFVYFDLGGVVFDWEDGVKNISALSGKSLDAVKEVFLKHDDSACRGQINPQEFGKIYERELSFSFGNKDFLTFWVNGFKPILETHKLIHELADRKVPIGIITNIYQGTYEKALGRFIPDINYQAIIKSCDYGLVKPDLEFLKIAEEACGFEKNQITLIDDNKTNIETAIKFGWNTALFEKHSVDTLTTLFLAK